MFFIEDLRWVILVMRLTYFVCFASIVPVIGLLWTESGKETGTLFIVSVCAFWLCVSGLALRGVTLVLCVLVSSIEMRNTKSVASGESDL